MIWNFHCASGLVHKLRYLACTFSLPSHSQLKVICFCCACMMRQTIQKKSRIIVDIKSSLEIVFHCITVPVRKNCYLYYVICPSNAFLCIYLKRALFVQMLASIIITNTIYIYTLYSDTKLEILYLRSF